MRVPSIEPPRISAFVSHLHLLVSDEAGIWKTPCESTVVLGKIVTHGPWPPEACSWVLQRWLEAGLLGLYRRELGETHDLSAAEAKAALAAVEPWTPSIGLFLFPTEAGKATQLDAWASVLS